MTRPPGLPARLEPGCRVLLRADLNVPIEDGVITCDKRIRSVLPTVRRLARAGCRVLVMSHLGRPRAGEATADTSLRPIARAVSRLLDAPVGFRADWIDGAQVGKGKVAILENVRLLPGETRDQSDLAQRMASLCDLYVMDAFGSAHRAHASTHAVARFAPRACAGPLLLHELRMLDRALEEPARPLVAVVGGSKVSTKIGVLEHLDLVADQLIVGGGIANTFAAAAGLPIGHSLYEPAQTDLAAIIRRGRGAKIPLPLDVVCAQPHHRDPVTRAARDVREDEKILDIGPKTRSLYDRILRGAGTIIWNGPVGMFEDARFAEGTRALSRSVAHSDAYSIAGGGDTVAAAGKFRVRSRISHLSTGGGAFLEYAAGRPLPAVNALLERAA